MIILTTTDSIAAWWANHRPGYTDLPVGDMVAVVDGNAAIYLIADPISWVVDLPGSTWAGPLPSPMLDVDRAMSGDLGYLRSLGAEPDSW